MKPNRKKPPTRDSPDTKRASKRSKFVKESASRSDHHLPRQQLFGVEAVLEDLDDSEATDDQEEALAQIALSNESDDEECDDFFSNADR
jgi:hypothetical protein